MDSYSSYLIELLYHFKNYLHNTEVFIFSTSLLRISDELSYGDLYYVAKIISERVKIWGSGTKIGHCLDIFIREYGELIDKYTLLIIISDGWDMGDIDLLEKNLKWLKDRVKEIIWLNPLLDIPNYKPLTLGMKAALPFIGIFCSPSIFKDSKIYEKYLGKAIRLAS
ncbi:hypothetical protein HRbin06_00764 [archaeon HR06]|nr:hypothetical protein HRbin06_00764 [archaeon HR06]